MNKLEKIGLGLSIIIAVSCTALFFTWQAGRYMEFDSDKWKNEQQASREHIRKKMIHSLIESKRLIGKTPQEVEDLLGPTTRNIDSDCDQVYYVGPESFGVDSVLLCINFSDRGGRAVAVRTVTD